MHYRGKCQLSCGLSWEVTNLAHAFHTPGLLGARITVPPCSQRNISCRGWLGTEEAGSYPTPSVHLSKVGALTKWNPRYFLLEVNATSTPVLDYQNLRITESFSSCINEHLCISSCINAWTVFQPPQQVVVTIPFFFFLPASTDQFIFSPYQLIFSPYCIPSTN